MNITPRNAPRGDRRSELRALHDSLEEATGAEEALDTALAAHLDLPSGAYTSDAALCRELVTRLIPEGRLQVGYDVSGVLPQAALRRGASRFVKTAPTVPLAILRALAEALGADEADAPPPSKRG